MIDKIISLLKKYREQIAYLIFGSLTTLISWGLSSGLFYFVFDETRNLLCNIIAESVAITFAYITNKLFVFQSKTPNIKSFLKEMISFYGLRIFATLFNLGAMYLFVDILNGEFALCKIVVNVIVIILNYVFSKLFIFNKDKSQVTNND